jgi:hypothetical protein
MATWHVHATVAALAALYDRMGDQTAMEHHRIRSRTTILHLANSMPADEPLRATFLSAPVVRKVLGDAAPIIIAGAEDI